MSDRRIVAALVAALFVAASASGCRHDGEPGSCYRDRDSACVEYGPSNAAAAKRVCAGFRWTPGAGTCPKENRLGACARDGYAEYIYSGPPNQFTAEAARAACASAGGSFQGGGGGASR